ncbi:MAG: hypothetical protein JNL18_05995 [Planctomycetaceae bacterium]|jgi:hypothetical protein|nr:hypothetical protein [Planctomycetaceae bacterium]
MSRIELTDDEFAMLNWIDEFPNAPAPTDRTIASLVAKGLIFVTDGQGVVSDAGRRWLDGEGTLSP